MGIQRFPHFIIFHFSISCSSDHAAFAGEVDGKQIAVRFILSRIYLLKYFSAVLPLTKICSISAVFKIGIRSLGTTFFIVVSALPVYHSFR